MPKPLMDYIKLLEKENDFLREKLLSAEKSANFNAFFVSSNPIKKFVCFTEASQYAVKQTKEEPIFVYGAKKIGQTVIKKVSHLELNEEKLQ